MSQFSVYKHFDVTFDTKKCQITIYNLQGMHARNRMKNEHIETMSNLVPGQTHTDTRMCAHPLGCMLAVDQHGRRRACHATLVICQLTH